MDQQRRESAESIEDRLEAFERENPAVAEAIRLFGMSLAEYQGAINAMHSPRVYTTNSTGQVPQQARDV